jgi:hypothetical protein
MRVSLAVSVCPGGAEKAPEAHLRLGPRGLALAASLPLSVGRLARGTRALAALAAHSVRR